MENSEGDSGREAIHFLTFLARSEAKNTDSIAEVLTFYDFVVQKSSLFTLTWSQNGKNPSVFEHKKIRCEKTPLKVNDTRIESEDLSNGIGGEARAMSPSSVGQGSWGPLKQDNRFR